MPELPRRTLLLSGLAAAAARAPTPGERLAAAARAQLGVTRDYDPAYRRIAYPNGDVPRSTGVCADVVIRAARDALGLDLQRLVHEDMARAFAAYPSRRAWGLTAPDANIDHRRVLNLEVYWRRQGAERAPHAPPQAGDLLTWRLWGRLPHVGVVTKAGLVPMVVHNIGGGVQETALVTLAIHKAVGHYRWPKG